MGIKKPGIALLAALLLAGCASTAQHNMADHPTMICVPTSVNGIEQKVIACMTIDEFNAMLQAMPKTPMQEQKAPGPRFRKNPNDPQT
jgi:hypothetical protein